MSFFGLNIGSEKIKLVQVEKSKEGLNLVHLGEVNAPVPGISSDSKANWDEVVGSVKRLLADLNVKTKNTVLSLPEDQVISRLKWFPPMKESEVRAALEFEAETFIPYPLEKVQLDYQVLEKDQDGKLLVFVIAAPQKIVEKYLYVAKEVGLRVLGLESTAVSLARIFGGEDMFSLILEMNDHHSIIVIQKQGRPYLVQVISMGCDAFTRTLSTSLNLEEQTAESYCYAYGLSEEHLEGKVKKILMPVFNLLADQINKVLLSFKEEWNQKVGLLILSGKAARIPDFSEELTRRFGLEIQAARPFLQVKVGNTFIRKDLENRWAEFSTVLGLAVRGMLSKK